MKLEERLEEFVRQHKLHGTGAISVGLAVTDHARQRGLPLDPAILRTTKQGQVAGLGPAKIQSILKRYGISRILSKEAGRTSRGSLGNMELYVDFLNTLNESSPIDLETVERWWIGKVIKFLAVKPFALRTDQSLGLRAMIRSILSQAENRQKEIPGSTYVGTLMQHLVGAKLVLVIGETSVEHNSASTNDSGHNRHGDFEIGDVVIHVTGAPSEALIRKCLENLDAGLRVIIVTSRKGCAVADGLAEQANIAERVDVFEIDAWLASNLQEMGKFQSEGRQVKINALIEKYNSIVDAYESDPSLKIETARKKKS